jgi:hypothetical protein
MPEGLSQSEVGKEISEHQHKAEEGISGHFKVRVARLGLISIAGVILVFSSVSLILAPKPPV